MVDRPGLDSCRVIKLSLSRGWRLSGTAVFVDRTRPCHLTYDVFADAAFRTKHGSVVGYVGKRAVNIRCECSRNIWRINGIIDPTLSDCIDVDFGFTPATNLLAIRRLKLAVGESAEASAAFLALPSCRFKTLRQRYERISRAEYLYEAPAFHYSATLDVSPLGAVRRYPGLFELLC
jgi:uncharacterized protein